MGMGMKKKQELDSTANAAVYNKLKRQELNCPLCPPHRKENVTRCKHGRTKPKYKNHR